MVVEDPAPGRLEDAVVAACNFSSRERPKIGEQTAARRGEISSGGGGGRRAARTTVVGEVVPDAGEIAHGSRAEGARGLEDEGNQRNPEVGRQAAVLPALHRLSGDGSGERDAGRP